MQKIELLAPAGDLEKLKVALMYGADAVYIGGQNFSLRANANNFSIEEIKAACLYAHSLNKKIYITINIVFHNKDLEGLVEYLKELEEAQVDAIIISDHVVIETVKENNINLEMHLSTQSSTINSEAAKYYINKGIARLVLAREASKQDIKDIKDETAIDLECFIHGAMCVSFSGKCVLSNYATNRDSNRGGCAQICRWTFDIGKENLFSMTPKDLNMVPYIKDMIDVGVNSFKVEGRMRSIYYIATVMHTYRRIIDGIINNTINDAYIKYYLNILNRCANRDSVPQFFDKLPGVNEQYFLGRKEESNQDFLAIVKNYNEEKRIVTLEQRNYFEIGTIVEFFGTNMDSCEFEITSIYDESGEKIDVARHPQMTVKMPCNLALKQGDMMRLKVFDKPNIL